jgi:DNA replication protein DnaC
LNNLKSLVSSGDVSLEDRTLYSNDITKCELLMGDVRPLDADIGGLIRAMRFNPGKLAAFIAFKQSAWFLRPLHCEPDIPKSFFPYPSFLDNDMTFDSYEVKNETQHYLLQMAKALVVTVMLSPRQPFGLIMVGKAGVGKTHLTIACGKFFHANGRKVFYVTERMLGEEHNKHESLDHVDVRPYDVIIIDDINSECGVPHVFLGLIMPHVFRMGKTLLISSSTDTVRIKDVLSHVIGYDHELSNNFKIIRGINLPSYRKTWTGAEMALKLPREQLTVLCASSTAEYAGVMIEDNNSAELDIDKRLRPYIDLIEHVCPGKRIKVLGKAYDSFSKVTPDFYARGIKEYDVIIHHGFRDNNAAVEQFINLVSQAHEDKKKIVVIVTNRLAFMHKVMEKLSSVMYVSRKARMMDRLRVLFPWIMA